MPFLLGTSVAIPIRDGDPACLSRLAQLEGGVLLSVVSRVELEGGVYRDPAEAATRRPRLDAMLRGFPILAFDEAAADAYRSIVEAAGYSSRKLLDRMIAAQALVHRATLITANGDDFADVPGLSLLVW